MIAFFPTPYPDELLYSLFARYYVKSGYPIYRSAAEDIYKDAGAKPDMEFINPLTDDVRNLLIKEDSMTGLIMKHTMFPYYAAFLLPKLQEELLNQLANGKKCRCDMLRRIGTKSAFKGLRYCPLCAKEDIKRYEETYWHRLHQIPGVDICPIHHCRLKYGFNIEEMKSSPAFLCAHELATPSDTAEHINNEIEIKLSEYIMSVFIGLSKFTSQPSVNTFLDTCLEHTIYKSIRGGQRNITKLTEDFIKFYDRLPYNPIQETWQMQKIFTGDCVNPYEICMVAYFLNVDPAVLIKRPDTASSQKEEFDHFILSLHAQGYNYRQISEKTGASYDVVKAVGAGKYQKEKALRVNKGGCKGKDWNALDKKYLPIIKDAILSLKEKDGARPVRITESMIEKHLSLPSKSLKKMSKCHKEVIRHLESQSDYWCREILWAIDDIRNHGEVINWSGIRRRTNLSRHNFLKCVPLLLCSREKAAIEEIVSNLRIDN